jgi:hypothetical protein
MRTDLVRLCSRCALRTGDLEVCARCGEAAVVPLEPDAPGQALAVLGRRAMHADIDRLRLMEWLVDLGWGDVHKSVTLHRIFAWWVFAIATMPVLGFFATPVPLWVLWIPVTVATAAVIAPDIYIARARRALDRQRREVRALPPVEIGGRALLAAPEATELVGRVRRRADCHAPLTGRECVAFRLVGRVDRFAVDDAGGEDFDLVLPDGRIVIVRLAHAALALDVDEPALHAGPASAALVAFLAARQVPAVAPFRLAEAVLRDGDAIAVAGKIETAARADGLRGTRFDDEMRGRPDAPLVITVRPPG